MDPQPPLVSVIIPAHNAASHIAETIQSVLDQSYENIEVVVVDDGSTDGTAAELNRFEGRIRCLKQSRGGLGSARNSGMKMAEGAYLAWLDADDLCHPHRVAVQAAFLDANREVDVISTAFSAFNDGGILSPSFGPQYYSALRSPRGLRALFAREERFEGRGVPWLAAPFDAVYPVFWGDVRDTIIWGNFVHPPTLMLRRSVVERTGGLDDQYGIAVDWEYLIRASESSRFAYVDAPLLQYRLHAGQMSADGNAPRLATDIFKVVEASLRRRPDIPRRFPEETRRLRARTHLRLAQAYAETKKGLALRSFTRSLLLHPYDRRLPSCLVSLLLPVMLLRAIRRMRHPGR